MKHAKPIKFSFKFFISINAVVERSRNTIRQLPIFKLSFQQKLESCHHIQKYTKLYKTEKSSDCKILRTQYANKMFNLKPTSYDIAN